MLALGAVMALLVASAIVFLVSGAGLAIGGIASVRPAPPPAVPADPPAAGAAVRALYRDASVLVTGAGGSIGSELARQCLALRPRRLVLLDLSEYALYAIDRALRGMPGAGAVDIVPVLGSVGDEAMVARLLARHDIGVVLHAAAYKHVPLVEANPAAGLSNNVIGTEVLVRAAAAASVGRFVLLSSDKAVRPAGLMGASKWIAEQVVQDVGSRAGGMLACVVRFGNVLGSSGSVLPLFREQAARGGPVTVTDPRAERYFMSVSEAVHLVLQAGAMSAGGEVFLFDMGAPRRIVDLAREVVAETGGRAAIVFTGLRPGEKLREELTWSRLRHPTAHPRIFTAPEPRLSEIECAQLLRDVRTAVAEGRGLDLDAVGGLRRAVSKPSGSADGGAGAAGRTVRV
ncbi:polysaccharide biosynthesis protein [Rhodobacterales bacterium HKCCE2091]|nr:polysaccharide biosynthesis protein [Rhodobacterales bacterium HKCCE2091]